MRYFDISDFDCKCGKCDIKGELMDSAHLEMLDEARERAGHPFVVNRGVSCPAHNEAVGGSETSSHLPTRGYATDIAVSNSTARHDMIRALMFVGFSRIGIGKSFIHVDNDPGKPEEVMWVYK